MAHALAVGQVSARAAAQLCTALGRLPDDLDEPVVRALLLDGVGPLLQHSTGGVPEGAAGEPLREQVEQDAAALQRCVDDDLTRPAARVEPALVLLAQHVAPAQLGWALRALLDPLQPDGSDGDAPDPCYLELRPLPGGDVDVRGLLDAETGQALVAEIERRLRRARSTATPDEVLTDRGGRVDVQSDDATEPEQDDADGADGAELVLEHEDGASFDALFDRTPDPAADGRTDSTPVADAPPLDPRQAALEAWDAAFAAAGARDAGLEGGGAGHPPGPPVRSTPDATPGPAGPAPAAAPRPPRPPDPPETARSPVPTGAPAPAEPPGSPRLLPVGRRRHDALRDLLHDTAGAAAGDGEPLPCRLTVHATLAAVEGRIGALPGLLTTPGHPAPLAAATLQRLGCSSELDAVLLDAVGRPVGASHSRRMPTSRERRALRARWGPTCAVAGCTSTRTVPHHVEPWWLAHRTGLAHLVPLREHCHHDLHEGHRTLRLRDGRLVDDRGWSTRAGERDRTTAA